MFNPEQQFIHVTPHKHPEIPEEPSLEQIEAELIERIKEIRGSGKSIGSGKTAEVFVSSLDSRICYKIIRHNCQEFRVASNEEGEFLSQACRLDSSVKVPAPFYSIVSDDGFEVLVMERLNAVSLRDILDGKAELPQHFDPEPYFEKLKRFIARMHEERNIYHRDIHPGNLMVDLDSGTPGIIDFGASIKVYGESENPYLRWDHRGNRTIATEDEVSLRDTKISLKKHLFSSRQT